MNLYILALVAAFSFASAWTVQDWRHDAEELQSTKAAVKKADQQAATVHTAATGHETDKVQIRTVTRTIVKEVDRVVKEDHFYAVDSPTCFDGAGLRVLQAAAANNAASEPASPVPGPKPAR